MAWADPVFQKTDAPLHRAAINFISAIFNKHAQDAPEIETIKIKRQHEDLDVLAIINQNYAILIEDKIKTKNHSRQLYRYREAIEKYNPDLIQLPIYYKTYDQSHYRSVIKAGYAPFTRKDMLPVLIQGKEDDVTNPIFLDYLRHLKKLELAVSAYLTKPVSEWDGRCWEGFYQALQKDIDGNWKYVHNKSGGFQAFWWSSNLGDEFYPQLEQDKLCIKIKAGNSDNKRQLRKERMKQVLQLSDEKELNLKRPSRLGTGKTMTFAENSDYMQFKADGMVDVEGTAEWLKRY
ncbi:PD-(D/E)XK nuclease family protein [Lentibacillus sp. JNUCC-1]|uniref:PD-(D/E)XK nuclease family protein n=1 Tax=Lentibacillus sp. JNUCC-1 TaxID=2654513 RepID=UPI001E5CD747|nr:PD-(D/E)XK nuclease family protein [Lentibacillus sp. JNUCC-1]